MHCQMLLTCFKRVILFSFLWLRTKKLIFFALLQLVWPMSYFIKIIHRYNYIRILVSSSFCHKIIRQAFYFIPILFFFLLFKIYKLCARLIVYIFLSMAWKLYISYIYPRKVFTHVKWLQNYRYLSPIVNTLLWKNKHFFIPFIR